MIRPLRRAHRTIFLLLAILLPIVIAVAIAGRPAADALNRLPQSEPLPR
jgi:hypothetical protein